MKRGSRVPAVGAGAIVLLLVFAALFMQSSEREGSRIAGSIGSAQDRGRRALALLLGRVGLRAEGWRQVPAALPPGANVVWMADGDAVERARASGSKHALPQVGMHAPEHYAAFVERGGTLIVEGNDGLEFLRETLEFEPAEGLAITTLDGDGPRSVRLRSGETLSLDVNLAFEALDPGSAAREIAVVVDEAGVVDLALAIEIPIGAGRAIAVADSHLFENQSVGELDHALFAVRLAEEAPPGARVLLDEYSLGLWQQGGPLDVATRPALALFTLNALLGVLVWTWMRAAPRAFPRDPEPLESFSPVLRARAQARLFERAGRVDLLVPAARAAVFARLAARLRLGKRHEGRESGGPTEADVTRLADALGVAGGPDLAARARDALHRRRVSNRADFEQLARDLARIEEDVRAADAEGRGDRGPELGV